MIFLHEHRYDQLLVFIIEESKLELIATVAAAAVMLMLLDIDDIWFRPTELEYVEAGCIEPVLLPFFQRKFRMFKMLRETRKEV